LTRTVATARNHQYAAWMAVIRAWLLIPLTLWPVDIIGLAKFLLRALKTGRGLDSRVHFVLEQLSHLPSLETQDAVAVYEHLVKKGEYQPFIKSNVKFAEKEIQVLQDKELRREWRNLKQLFDVQEQRGRGVIRRSMTQERNFHAGWNKLKTGKAARFQLAFDAFCNRWNLYGMEGDRPLLLKLSVTITPHGTMIMIPAYWSFDPKRDLKWREINRLHKSRGVLRQGPRMSESRLARSDRARHAVQLANQASRQGLKGEVRRAMILKGLRLHPDTDSSEIRRLLRQGRKL